MATIGITAATLVAVATWGTARLENDGLIDQGRRVRVALIQGNIPQDEKWDPAQAARILNTWYGELRGEQ